MKNQREVNGTTRSGGRLGRLAAAALTAATVVLVTPRAHAQSCSAGLLYCSAGWCCPPGEGGSTNVCCNSNPQSEGCTSNGVCSNSSGNSSGNTSSGNSSGNTSSGGTCTTTGTDGCTLEACVSSDSQTCSYTLNGSGVCSAACSNFSSCEDQAGQALASCEGGGSSGNSGGNSGGGCQFAGVHPGDAASWAALVVGGALIALLRWRRRGDLARA